MVYDNAQNNQRYIEPVHRLSMRNRRMTDPSFLYGQQRNRYEPYHGYQQRINVNSVTGDGVSSYRSLSLNAPPPPSLNAPLRTYDNGGLDNSDGIHQNTFLQIENQQQFSTHLDSQRSINASHTNPNTVPRNDAIQVNTILLFYY